MTSLKPYNSFQVKAFAKDFQVISSLSDLSNLGNLSPIFILGEGCNTLFTKDWPGLVLKNNLHGITQTSDTTVQVASGDNWHNFVTWAVDHNLSGIENLALIPGSVGAAVAGNIGAYGQSVSDTLVSVETNSDSYPAADLGLAYRTSNFKKNLHGQFITSATFELSKTAHFSTNYYSRYESLDTEIRRVQESNTPTLQDIYQAVINIRTLKLPDWTKIGTDGSVFKKPFVPRDQYLSLRSHIPELQWYPTAGMDYPPDSPDLPDTVKIPAGRLLDELGWRGKTIGNVSTHTNHALVVINLGGATGREIYKYCELMRANVKKAYDIDLEYEIEVV